MNRTEIIKKRISFVIIFLKIGLFGSVARDTNHQESDIDIIVEQQTPDLFILGTIKTEILQGYIDTVLLKDVIERHQVNNITAIKHLVRTKHAFVHMYKIHTSILYKHTKYLTLKRALRD